MQIMLFSILQCEKYKPPPNLSSTHLNLDMALSPTAPTTAERVSRRLPPVIVREMECKTGLGLRVLVAAFSVTRSRS